MKVYRELLVDRLERKFRRFALPNLMLYIVVGMGIVFAFDLLAPTQGFSLTELLMFSRELVFRGQVWRVISFLLIPPDSSLLFILLSLYFYYFIGTALEREWGAFRFNLFYLTGWFGTLLGGLLVGSATNSYLNLSLFLAFALLYPNHKVLLFFVIPLKVKWLAWADLVLLAISFIFSGWAERLALLISLINVALFFWGDFTDSIRRIFRRARFKKQLNDSFSRRDG